VARVRRLLHPSDFSPASGPAFKKAIELAKENNATLIVVHVLPILPVIGDAFIPPSTIDEMIRGQRAQAEQAMERLVKRARAAGVKATGTVLDNGAVPDAIVRFSRRQKSDLIVMGTHGHGFLARTLLGSVAERVVSKAPVPVMLIRGK
jgi:nucleotide-binding universal stress UspA family protein